MSKREKRKTEIVNEDGWTDWIYPQGNEEGIYQLACCDCSLVHDMIFVVAKQGKPVDKNFNEWKAAKNKNVIPIFKARRNNRATAQSRRRERETDITNLTAEETRFIKYLYKKIEESERDK